MGALRRLRRARRVPAAPTGQASDDALLAAFATGALAPAANHKGPRALQGMRALAQHAARALTAPHSTPRHAPPTQASRRRAQTELCTTFLRAGVCPYGQKCQFAHGVEELRERQARRGAYLPAGLSPVAAPRLATPPPPPVNQLVPHQPRTTPPAPRRTSRSRTRRNCAARSRGPGNARTGHAVASSTATSPRPSSSPSSASSVRGFAPPSSRRRSAPTGARPRHARASSTGSRRSRRRSTARPKPPSHAPRAARRASCSRRRRSIRQ